MRSRRVEIRCPKCNWKPCASSQWSCGEACLHSWNTFDTAGICPACGRIWKSTQCLACNAWSPHADWYRADGGGDGAHAVRHEDACSGAGLSPAP